MEIRSANTQSSGIMRINASNLRQDEELERRDAERLKRFDFLIHLHRAQLRGKRGAGAAADDDAGHDAGHLAHCRNRHKIGRVDGGAELGEFRGTHEGEDQAR